MLPTERRVGRCEPMLKPLQCFKHWIARSMLQSVTPELQKPSGVRDEPLACSRLRLSETSQAASRSSDVRDDTHGASTVCRQCQGSRQRC